MKAYFLIILLLAGITLTWAHGGKKQKKDSTVAQADSIKQEHEHGQGDTVRHHDEGMQPDQSKLTAELGDFPSLHPLIVHFAIVLIIVAAALQVLNVIILKRELAWIIAVLLLIGFLAAWFASKNFHPHTHGISAHAELVLEQHEKFADWTLYTAGAGLILQILHLLLMTFNKKHSADFDRTDQSSFKLARSFTIIVALILLSSAYCVSRAGHYGAQLVHIEGIGPQGKFLEMEH